MKKKDETERKKREAIREKRRVQQNFITLNNNFTDTQCILCY